MPSYSRASFYNAVGGGSERFLSSFVIFFKKGLQVASHILRTLIPSLFSGIHSLSGFSVSIHWQLDPKELTRTMLGISNVTKRGICYGYHADAGFWAWPAAHGRRHDGLPPPAGPELCLRRSLPSPTTQAQQRWLIQKPTPWSYPPPLSNDRPPVGPQLFLVFWFKKNYQLV